MFGSGFFQEAALRCKKEFSSVLEDDDEVLKEMLDWAFGGFQPSGPTGLKPVHGMNTYLIYFQFYTAHIKQ